MNSTATNSSDTTNNGTIAGIDISHFQGNEIDSLNSSNSQLKFVICKATEGVTYTDPDFANNWKMIKQQGFIRGAYHFYHCADDPTQQANFFLETLGTLESTDFPPIVDFEENSIDQGCNKSTIQQNLLTFLSILQQKTGRTPILYTDNNIGNTQITNPVFANYPLWIADYNQGASPSIPTVWKEKSWTIWQKTESYSLESFTNDYDVFNGDNDAFSKFFL